MGRAKGSRNRNRLGPVRPYLVRLPIEVADRVDAAAAAEGVPVATWLRNVLRREAGLWTGQREETAMHVFDICAGKSIELPNHRSVIRYDEAADAGRDQRSALPDSAVSNRPMVRLSDTEAGDRVYVQNQFTGHWLLAEVE